MVGNEIYYQVDWTAENGTHMDLQDGQSIFDLDADKLADDVLKSTCNTRKNKDKRCRRHTAGIFISARPCGIIPHIDEMHRTESTNQTYGSILDFYGELSVEERESIKCWMYDDMCHFKVCWLFLLLLVGYVVLLLFIGYVVVYNRDFKCR